MGKTKTLHLNIGDIIVSKARPERGETYFVVDKQERGLEYDRYYIYTIYSFDRNNYYSICRDINNKHYKVLA